jgi:membrane carboxypeptidase/penicillin-binding protein
MRQAGVRFPRGKTLLWAIACLLAAFLAYEGIAVARAKMRTPETLKRVEARPLALESVSKRRIETLLAVDDPGFFSHSGVDFSTPGQGMTTLTQALVKRLYFDKFEPGFAKIEQSLIARFVLHPAMSKEDQLEVFLNYASFGWHKGREVIGFTEAARTFYGKEFGALTDDEFVSLVAMLAAPRDLNPVRHPEANAERSRRIKALILGHCKPSGLRDVALDACAT